MKKKISGWQLHVVNTFSDNIKGIGRGLSRELGIPWSSLWDVKQKMQLGILTPESVLVKPKILFTDIETAPIRADVWSLWGNFVSINQINSDWFMLSHASMWLGDSVDDVIYRDIRMNPQDLYEENDKALCQEIWKLLDEADIVIGHNAKKFDIKKINARFLYWGLGIPSPYKVVDTLNIAKSAFALTSNKLDYLATYLGLENKVHHEGHALWTKCMKGDKGAWAIMEEYNRYDTVLLEDVYLLIRHWDKKHPNLALYYNDYKTRCNVCGSDNVHEVKGKKINTNLSKFAAYQCGDCGVHLRDGINELPKEKRKSLLRNVI